MGKVNASGRRQRYAPLSNPRQGGYLPYLIADRIGLPALCRLPAREQELATIIYLDGEATATELEKALSASITNSAIRSMLTRLVAKGILRSRKEGKKFVYRPAVFDERTRELALTRVTEDYFDGSLASATMCLLRMLLKAEPEVIQGLVARLAEPAGEQADRGRSIDARVS